MKYLLILLSFLSVFAFAETASVQEYWIAPTQRSDGSPLALKEISEYTVRYRLAGAATYTIVKVLPPALSVRIDDLPYGNYEISYSATDTKGLVSKWSVTALFTVSAAPVVESYVRVTKVQ